MRLGYITPMGKNIEEDEYETPDVGTLLQAVGLERPKPSPFSGKKLKASRSTAVLPNNLNNRGLSSRDREISSGNNSSRRGD